MPIKISEAERRAREGFTFTRRRFFGGAAGVAGAAAAGALGLHHASRAPTSRCPRGGRFCSATSPAGGISSCCSIPRDPTRFLDSERSRTLIELRYNELEGYLGYRAQLVRPRMPSPFVFGPLAARAGRLGQPRRLRRPHGDHARHQHGRPRARGRVPLLSHRGPTPRGRARAARASPPRSPRSSRRASPRARCPTSRSASRPTTTATPRAPAP